MNGIAFYGNQRQDAYLPQIARFLKMLEERGASLYMAAHFAEYLHKSGVEGTWTICREFPAGEVERVVSFGGDGTFLRTASWVGYNQTPIMGINTGHLGFLASYSLDSAEELVDILMNGLGKVESRMVLRVESPHIPEGFWPYALNEVAILKSDTSSMLDVRTWVDGNYLADYLADGLLVATPTGSTAYNLSVGGPIMDPTVSNMALSPIAPHSLTMRPLVIGGDSRVSVAVINKARRCRISLDGRPFGMPCVQDSETAQPVLNITKAGFAVNILRRPESHFSNILRNKLMWGQGLIPKI